MGAGRWAAPSVVPTQSQNRQGAFLAGRPARVATVQLASARGLQPWRPELLPRARARAAPFRTPLLVPSLTLPPRPVSPSGRPIATPVRSARVLGRVSGGSFRLLGKEKAAPLAVERRGDRTGGNRRASEPKKRISSQLWPLKAHFFPRPDPGLQWFCCVEGGGRQTRPARLLPGLSTFWFRHVLDAEIPPLPRAMPSAWTRSQKRTTEDINQGAPDQKAPFHSVLRGATKDRHWGGMPASRRDLPGRLPK